MAEPNDVPFGFWAHMDPSNHVVDGWSRSSHGKGQFWWIGAPIVKYRGYAKTAEPTDLPFGLCTQVG